MDRRRLILMGARPSWLPVRNVIGVWAMRRVLPTYTGSILKLRRSSDDATMAFGADSRGVLNTSAITTWLGAATAYVDTVYDQSGNGLDIAQATTTRQPRFDVTARSIVFDSASKTAWVYLATGNVTQAQPLTVVVNSKSSNSGAVNDRIFRVASGPELTAKYNSTNEHRVISTSGWVGNGVEYTNTWVRDIASLNGASSAISQNGVVTTGNPGATGIAATAINWGAGTNASTTFDGSTDFLAVYNAALSTSNAASLNAWMLKYLNR